MKHTEPQIQSVSDVVARFDDAWVPIAAAAAVLALGLGVGLLLGALTRRVLLRLRADALGPNSDELPAMRRTADIGARGVFWLTFLAALTLAAELVGLSLLAVWVQSFTAYAPQVLLALTIAGAGYIVGRIAGDIAARFIGRGTGERAERVSQLACWGITSLAVLVAATQLGIDVSFVTRIVLVVLAVILAGFSLAFALGAREFVADILGLHYVARGIRAGEHISVAGVSGRVLRVTSTAIIVEVKTGELAIPGRLIAANPVIRLHEPEVTDDD